MRRAALLAAMLLIGAAVRGEGTWIWLEAEDADTLSVLERRRLDFLPPYSAIGRPLALDATAMAAATDPEQRISGGAFLGRFDSPGEYTAAEQKGTPPGNAAWKFRVDQPGDYVVWLRVSIPAPCESARFAVWMNDTGDPGRWQGISRSLAGRWFWWRWGSTFSEAKPTLFPLTAGEHTLHVGHVSSAVRLDRILITSDLEYVPLGSSQAVYEQDFEPRRWQTAANGSQPAVGWLTSGPWVRERDPLTGNHFLAALPAAEGAGASTAKLRDFEGDLIEARFDLLPPTTGTMGPAAILFPSRDGSTTGSLLLASDGLTWRTEGGDAPDVTASLGPKAAAAFGRRTMVCRVERDRANLRVYAGEELALEAATGFPPPASFELAAPTGNVGFDNVTVHPLARSRAEFAFAPMSAESALGWATEAGEALMGTPPSGRLVVSRAGVAPGTETTLHAAAGLSAPVEILYPWVDSRNYVRARLDPAARTVTLAVVSEGSERVLGRAGFSAADAGSALAFGTVRLATFHQVLLNGQVLIETSESSLVAGRVAIRTEGAPEKSWPIARVAMRSREALFDSFPPMNGELAPHWVVRQGNWRVVASAEGDAEDGQLAAMSAGVVAIRVGEPASGGALQVSALVQDGEPVGLVAGSQPDGTGYEAAFSPGQVSLRRLTAGGQALTLAEAEAPDLTAGWHRLSLQCADGSVNISVDGDAVLRHALEVPAGDFGLAAHGNSALFDNLFLSLEAGRSVPAAAAPAAPALDGILSDF